VKRETEPHRLAGQLHRLGHAAGLEDKLYFGRAHRAGHGREHVNQLGYALAVNSLTLHEHRQPQRLASERLGATALSPELAEARPDPRAEQGQGTPRRPRDSRARPALGFVLVGRWKPQSPGQRPVGSQVSNVFGPFRNVANRSLLELTSYPRLRWDKSCWGGDGSGAGRVCCSGSLS